MLGSKLQGTLASICVVLVTFSIGQAELSNTYLNFNEASRMSRQEVADRISGIGGQLRHSLGSGEYIAWLPAMADSALGNRLSNVYVEDVGGRSRLSDGIGLGAKHKLWKAYLKSIQSLEPPEGEPPEQFAATTALASNDYCGYSAIEVNGSPLEREAPLASIGPVHTTYTSYMIGSIAVAITLMESVGPQSTFDWTTREEDDAIAQAILAFDQLSEQGENRGVRVAWVYEINRGVPTLSEPISESDKFPHHNLLGWHFSWLDEALSFLGMAQSEWDGSFDLAATLRYRNQTDYAIALYVIKDDPSDRTFPGGNHGYALRVRDVNLTAGVWIRSPFAVVTSTLEGSVPSLHKLIIHEVSHTFGAMDEYNFPGGAPSDCDKSSDCSEVQGFLRFPNQNCKLCPPHVSCVMDQLSNWPNLCQYTLGHLGWVDSDGDGNPDPIDPNSGYWRSMFPVVPGDLVEMWTLDGDFIDAISVTENKFDDATTGVGIVIWDGRNFDNVQVSPLNTFYYTVSGGPPTTFAMNQGNLAVKPVFSNAGFWSDDSLRFKLGGSYAYVKIELFDSSNTLFGRPVWNKLMLSSTTLDRTVDLSYLPDGSYTAQFQGWRSDGGLSNPFSINFIQYRCGDASNDGRVNIADVTTLISLIFNGVMIDDPIERGDANGSGSVNISDVTYLITRIFNFGPAPICSGSQQ